MIRARPLAITGITTAAVAALVVGACVSLDHLTSDGDDAGAEAATESGSVLDAGDASQTSDAPNETTAPPADAGCDSSRGPVMVPANGYCIDSTEVTNDQYLAFLVAKAGDTSGQLPECAWNTSFVPQTTWPAPAGKENFPVVRVDWCDAFAFCDWAGKRMCGRIGGGALDRVDSAKASVSQWYAACSHNADSLHTYPYGNASSSVTCNGSENTLVTAAVGSFPKCEGGYPGIFDMAGNVYEWEDSCDGDAGDAGCSLRSGSCKTSGATMRCEFVVVDPRSMSTGDIGIRCCSR
jgi:formylglycine-generating enzyme required for sulfatase activity